MATHREKAVIATTFAGLAPPAMTRETVAYSYDARGRLIRVEHKGSVNANVTAAYSYDKADNRASVNIVSPNAPP